jgi:AraC family transcriptional regulator of adaptative response/methylated-DNA-[protein]-cysteine methyltransferase
MIIKEVLNSQEDIWYEALLNRDSSFEGQFIVGVKTTGIFCRPSCTARKPKKINTEFFRSVKDALDHGYRPCKICEPLRPLGTLPEWLDDLMSEVNQNPDIRLKDQDLRDRNIEPSRVRRWFKRHHGITFQAYLRSLRINKAFGQIRQGDKVIETAFDSGYDSLSGFTESFKKTIGTSPSNAGNSQVIQMIRIPSPLGPLLAGATEKGICLLEFSDRKMLETQIKRLEHYYKATLLPGTSRFFKQLESELNEYFKGERVEFNVPLDIKGSPFQEKVWKVLLGIPYGKTRSYMEQAKIIGDPKAVRAVAKANGDNRISIIIPCHRVVGSDGKLTGYGGGLWRKKWLLDLEGNTKQTQLDFGKV